jgi:hypothetical protein
MGAIRKDGLLTLTFATTRCWSWNQTSGTKPST